MLAIYLLAGGACGAALPVMFLGTDHHRQVASLALAAIGVFVVVTDLIFR